MGDARKGRSPSVTRCRVVAVLLALCTAGGPVALAITTGVGSTPASASARHAGRHGSPGVLDVAGTGSPGAQGDGALATRTELDAPSGIALDARGDLFVADTGNCRVLEIPAHDTTQFGVTMRAHHAYRVVGAGCQRPIQDFGVLFPVALAIDAGGDLYVADAAGNRVLELAATARTGAPRLRSVAGTGIAGFSGDGGPAAAARLDDPSGLALDARGDLFIADTGNCRVRELAAHDETSFGVAMSAGQLYTVAGSSTCGAGGDGGPATAAQLAAPTSLAVLEPSGDLLIAATVSRTVRAVAATSTTLYGVAIAADHIATVAGAGTYGPYLVDGLPATGPVAELNFPEGIGVDAAGNLYVADGYMRCIRVVAAAPGIRFGDRLETGDMYTVAGALPVGPGSVRTRWVRTHMTYPWSVAVDGRGDLFYCDQGANVVREILSVPPR